MQIIHVLRYQQELLYVLRQLRDRLMRRIRLRSANALAAFAVPIPNQSWILRECFGRSQLRRIEIPPVPVLPAKCRDPTFRGNARAGKNENACVQDPDCRASVSDANSLSVELKLIWLVVRMFDKVGAYRILSEVFPFVRQGFIRSQQAIETTFLPSPGRWGAV